jgi:hypothetical protein
MIGSPIEKPKESGRRLGYGMQMHISGRAPHIHCMDITERPTVIQRAERSAAELRTCLTCHHCLG